MAWGAGGADTIDYSALNAGIYAQLADGFAYKETAPGAGWANPDVAENGPGNGYRIDTLYDISSAVGTAYDDRM